MSVTQDEQMAELEALDGLLTAAKEMHDHEQLDPWRLGDEAVAYVRTRNPNLFEGDDGRHLTGVKTGLNELLDEAAGKVEEVAPEIDRATFRHTFSTARAWSEEERMPEKASFNAHRAFSAGRFDGRRSSLLRRVIRESSQGYATVKAARLKASEDLPKPSLKTPLQKTEDQVLATLRRIWNPTDRISLEDRKGISLILRQLAARVENGEAI